MARRAAIIGGGVIGGGWAARFLLLGWDVAVFDPDPEAPGKQGEVLAQARRARPSLHGAPLPPAGALTSHPPISAPAEGAGRGTGGGLPPRVVCRADGRGFLRPPLPNGSRRREARAAADPRAAAPRTD